MKILDTQEYVSVLKNLVEEGKEVGILIAGSSMEPFLKHGQDYIYFKAPDRELEKGDMVFYRRDNGQYIMHRIVNITSEGYYLLGDNQVIVEGPLRRDQIFAIVTKVKRKGRILEPDNLQWKFYAKVWPKTTPVRSLWGRIKRKIIRELEGQDR